MPIPSRPPPNSRRPIRSAVSISPVPCKTNQTDSRMIHALLGTVCNDANAKRKSVGPES
jgi:hypothetical protein